MDDPEVREMSLQESLTKLSPGEPIRLTADSPVHRDTYDARVLEVGTDRLRVSVPMDAGRVVLVPVGTTVTVSTRAGELDDAFSFTARVIDRRAGHDRSLVLGIPRSPSPGATDGQQPHVLAVASGKGGVGKTVLAVNLAALLARRGLRVCLLDGDLGTANVDVLLNLSPRYHLGHVITGQVGIFDVLVEGPHGIVVLPGGSGFQELTSLGPPVFEHLLSQVQQLEPYTDVLIIDTSAGLSRNVTSFLAAVQQSVVVTTPEPHAITDAYALIKVLSRQASTVPLRLVVNRANSAEEAEEIAEKMVFASRRFLRFDLESVGYLPEDAAVREAVRDQVDFVSRRPNGAAATQLQEIAHRLVGTEAPPVTDPAGGFRQFFRRFVRYMARGSTEVEG